jgi:acetoin utilization protein AcuB
MRIAEIMTANPQTIRPDATLREALEVMDTHDFHHLPVVSKSGNLLGVITARDCRLALRLPDVLREYWHDHDQIDRLLVRDVMNTGVVIAEPHVPAEEAARLMLLNYASCVIILRGETLAGIVTVSDVLVAFVATVSKLTT